MHRHYLVLKTLLMVIFTGTCCAKVDAENLPKPDADQLWKGSKILSRSLAGTGVESIKKPTNSHKSREYHAVPTDLDWSPIESHHVGNLSLEIRGEVSDHRPTKRLLVFGTPQATYSFWCRTGTYLDYASNMKEWAFDSSNDSLWLRNSSITYQVDAQVGLVLGRFEHDLANNTSNSEKLHQSSKQYILPGCD